MKYLGGLLFSTFFLFGESIKETEQLIYPGGSTFICTQSAEKVDNTWYKLTLNEIKTTPKLKLELLTKYYIILGGVMLERIKRNDHELIYIGITPKDRIMIVGIETLNPIVLNLGLERLHLKEYACKRKYK